MQESSGCVSASAPAFECAGLRVRRIDFLRRTVSVVEAVNEVGSDVVFGEPKTPMSRRVVSMPSQVAEELAAHLAKRAPVDPDDLVFTSPTGQPLRRKHFRKRVWLSGSVGSIDRLTWGFSSHLITGVHRAFDGPSVRPRSRPTSS